MPIVIYNAVGLYYRSIWIGVVKGTEKCVVDSIGGTLLLNALGQYLDFECSCSKEGGIKRNKVNYFEPHKSGQIRAQP